VGKPSIGVRAVARGHAPPFGDDGGFFVARPRRKGSLPDGPLCASTGEPTIVLSIVSPDGAPGALPSAKPEGPDPRVRSCGSGNLDFQVRRYAVGPGMTMMVRFAKPLSPNAACLSIGYFFLFRHPAKAGLAAARG